MRRASTIALTLGLLTARITFLGVSTDGGDSWTNALISDVAWNPDLAFLECGCFIGATTGWPWRVRSFIRHRRPPLHDARTGTLTCATPARSSCIPEAHHRFEAH